MVSIWLFLALAVAMYDKPLIFIFLAFACFKVYFFLKEYK